MEVELIDYTPNAINKIATLANWTHKNNAERQPIPTGENAQCKKLFKHLIKVGHDGAFEHVNFTFHVGEVSRALTHQLVRHRIGFSYLQQSDRVVTPNSFITPESVCKPPKEAFVACNHNNSYFKQHMIDSLVKYNTLIANGVPKEDARFILPNGYTTHITVTCNGRSLRHLLKLRLAKGAQWEIRALANKLFDIVYEIYPELVEDLKWNLK